MLPGFRKKVPRRAFTPRQKLKILKYDMSDHPNAITDQDILRRGLTCQVRMDIS